ncbi:MAG: hypothetical protein IT437_05810 [Phycisphaerales bacterium]|nr:hypothetical protein [Phycisphaerales bacterium]
MPGPPALPTLLERLKSLYARRIVNVNVNIVAAGLISITLVTGVVHLARRWWLEEGDYWLVSGVTFAADIVLDVAIYFFLHWWANHCGPRRYTTGELLHADLTYFKSVTLVQFERAALSPLLYAIALVLQQVMMRHGVSEELATAVSLLAGVGATRVLHTMWMLEQERRARARLRTGPAAAPQAVGPMPSVNGHAGEPQQSRPRAERTGATPG